MRTLKITASAGANVGENDLILQYNDGTNWILHSYPTKSQLAAGYEFTADDSIIEFRVMTYRGTCDPEPLVLIL